ncbi:MAG: hypothetical protein Q9170_000912 [Blastenia crenularia]
MTSSPSSPLIYPPNSHKSTAFRFKRKASAEPSASDPPPPKRRSYPPSSTCRSHRSHRHHHRRHRGSHDNHPHYPAPSSPDYPLDPETAFRESLFDALADDEGATFWESVYGQPIHTYSPYRPQPENDDPEQASLQRMTDDEYAAYVRARMWEKSHGYIIEERRRREEERIRRKEQEKEGAKWERGVEEALRRGEERRRKNRWKDAWGKYIRAWEALASSQDGGGGKATKKQIPWPVETGRHTEVKTEEVERFFKCAPQLEGGDEGAKLAKVLKLERIRWHPDKFLQRAGSQGLDEETMALVTAVFQIVDRLWSESCPR